MFGFGRRICPGMNIAERSLHLLSARLLWACNLSPKRDANGNEIPIPAYNYTAGFNTQPEHFDFDITVRTAQKQEIINCAYEDSKRTDPLREKQ